MNWKRRYVIDKSSQLTLDSHPLAVCLAVTFLVAGTG